MQPTQVGFAELKETAGDRVNIGGTIIGAPIVDQKSAQYILTNHQDADRKPMIGLTIYCCAKCWFAYIGLPFRLIFFRQSLVCSY